MQSIIHLTYAQAKVRIKQLHKERLAFKAGDVLCIHMESPATCSLEHATLQQPVIASDGQLYEKEALDLLITESLALEIEIFNPQYEPLVQFHHGEMYIPVRLAYKNFIPSLLNPDKAIMIENNGDKRYLVCVGRSVDEEDSAVLLIESLSVCSAISKSESLHGEINAYQLIRQSHFSDKISIKKSTYRNLEYATATQESILKEDFGLDLEQVEACSYICLQEHIDKLLKKINADQNDAKNGTLRYGNRASGSSQSIQSVSYQRQNASSWVVSLLRYAEILQIDQLKFDKNFRIRSPITQKIFALDQITGLTADQAIPRWRLFCDKQAQLKNKAELTTTNKTPYCSIL